MTACGAIIGHFHGMQSTLYHFALPLSKLLLCLCRRGRATVRATVYMYMYIGIGVHVCRMHVLLHSQKIGPNQREQKYWQISISN